MREEGMIGDKELSTAMSAPATRAASFWTGSENYVADRIMEELPGLIGDVGTDIVVDTTVDLTLQKLAEASIRRLIDESGKKLNVSQGALVSIDNSGAVRAMVGGYDYANSQFDRASEARRQPGSAFKPFVYLAAMEQGRTPDSTRVDAPDPHRQVDAGELQRQVLRQGHAGDGARQVAEFGGGAARHGGRSRFGGGGRAPHGHRVRPAGQHVAGARHVGGDAARTHRSLCPIRQRRIPAAGAFHQPHHHRRRQGALRECRQWLAACDHSEAVGQMNAMMAETMVDGTARKAAFAWPAAGKTGTSQNSRDAWFVGYTANLTTGVWFGNDDGAPMKKVTGGALPAMAWHEFMVAAHEGVPVAQLPGSWKSAPPAVDQSVPDTEAVGDSRRASRATVAQPAGRGCCCPVGGYDARRAKLRTGRSSGSARRDAGRGRGERLPSAGRCPPPMSAGQRSSARAPFST